MDHVGHDHTHEHGHDHDHGASEYYLEQLLTVLICGAMGITSILMWQFDRLNHLLVPKFHAWVLAGGIVLTLVTIIRGVSLWSLLNPKNPSHGAVGHVHGPDCNHDHGDHAHMPGGIYLKVIPFALPILLFVMGLPNAGFSKEWIERRLGKDAAIGDIQEVAEKGGDMLTLDFSELNMAAYDPGKRDQYEGKKIRVKGQLNKVSEKEYTLFKLKMTCCAADMIPLKARIKSEIIIPESQFKSYDWVNVEGVLQFVEMPETKQFIPVIRIGKSGQLGLTKATAE
jgi:uncharacterized repeat protein (TIGR03943 family)